MTKVHRQLLGTLDEVRAVALDTSYAFQANVPQMTEKIVEYFATSLKMAITPLHFGDHEASTPLDQAVFRQEVRAANFVFAGPGSPSYALRQWAAVGVGPELASVVAANGVLCFASAAALTLGAYTAPIYEIYKAGAKGHWLDGLDVLAVVGLRCAVIPHFDNAEGGNYDTRYCYLGEERLTRLESELPVSAGILGIDEHTAAIIDVALDKITVVGRANAYWRQDGRTRLLENGTTTPLAEIRESSLVARPKMKSPSADTTSDSIETLATTAALGGERGLEAIATLSRMASSAGTSTIDPSPMIDALLRLRDEARSRRDFSLSDRIRDLLVDSDVEVMDGPDGSSWSYSGN